MIKTPAKTAIPVVKVRDELESLYARHGFEDMLAICEPIVICDEHYAEDSLVHPDTIRIRGLKFRPGGRTCAVIFYYTHLDGSVTLSIRMLLIDSVPYIASPFPA
jgi:hypothetical protein